MSRPYWLRRVSKAPPSNLPYTQLPNVTYAQGAIAIPGSSGQTIGGLGVSGAPGGHLDEECARRVDRNCLPEDERDKGDANEDRD